jgi:hypothetical protein
MGCFDKSGIFLSNAATKELLVRTRHILLSSDAQVEISPIWVLALIGKPITVSVSIEDADMFSSSKAVNKFAVTPIVLDTGSAILDNAVFYTNNPYAYKVKFPMLTKGKTA